MGRWPGVRYLGGDADDSGQFERVDPARGREHVVGPQGDLPIAGVAGESKALLDQVGADAEAAGGGGDQQDP